MGLKWRGAEEGSFRPTRPCQETLWDETVPIGALRPTRIVEWPRVRRNGPSLPGGRLTHSLPSAVDVREQLDRRSRRIVEHPVELRPRQVRAPSPAGPRRRADAPATRAPRPPARAPRRRPSSANSDSPRAGSVRTSMRARSSRAASSSAVEGSDPRPAVQQRVGGRVGDRELRLERRLDGVVAGRPGARPGGRARRARPRARAPTRSAHSIAPWVWRQHGHALIQLCSMAGGPSPGSAHSPP